MAFPCRFKTALGRRVVPTPRIPAPTRLSNAESGKQSGTDRDTPEEGSAHTAPPQDDSGTEQLPPGPSSAPHIPGRWGAWQRTPTLTGPYHTLRPGKRHHYQTPPPPSPGPPVPMEGRRPPGPTLLPRPSLHRARPKEGRSPPGGGLLLRRRQAQLGRRRDPRAPGSGTSFCSHRPSATAPRSASAASQRRRQLTGGGLRRAPRVTPAPKALRDAQELTGTAGGHGGLYSTAVGSGTNAPLVRAVRGTRSERGNDRDGARPEARHRTPPAKRL